MYGHPYLDGGGPGVLGLILLALLVVALVLLGVAAARWLFAGAGAASARGLEPEDALATARARYARGELDRDQFLRMWEDLGGTPPGPPGDGS